MTGTVTFTSVKNQESELESVRTATEMNLTNLQRVLHTSLIIKCSSFFNMNIFEMTYFISYLQLKIFRVATPSVMTLYSTRIQDPYTCTQREVLQNKTLL